MSSTALLPPVGGQPEREDELEWTRPLRHDWSLPNLMSDQMLARLTAPAPGIHWVEVADSEL
jgi:hypothetical protein